MTALRRETEMTALRRETEMTALAPDSQLGPQLDVDAFQQSALPDAGADEVTLEVVGVDVLGAVLQQLAAGYELMAAQSYLEASLAFREAAVRGHREAQFELGKLYVGGLGVARDDAEAAGWFRRAAEQGHPGAQFKLGTRYAAGRAHTPGRCASVHVDTDSRCEFT